MAGSPGRPRQTGYLELLGGNADFRNLFVGRLVSLFGDWFNLLAILAMLRAFGADSAMAFAGVLIVKTLPAVIAPVAGVLADRLPRRSLMIAADLARAVVVLGMVGLAWFPSVFLLYTLVVLQTMLSGVYEPARNAIFPDLVKPSELTAANALSAASWSVMLGLGSAAGGLFTDAFGWQPALVLDAATYLVSAAFLVFVREPAVERQAQVGTGGLLDRIGVTELWYGATWMARRPRVWTLALVKPVWQLTGARTLVLTLLGETAFLVAGWPLFAVSVLYVARGVGTGLGPFFSRWLTASDPVAMERAIGWSFLVAAVGYVAVGFSPVLLVAVGAVVLSHLGGATIWVFSSIRLQQITPSAVRGRVFAAEHAGMTLVMAASTGVFGDVADRVEGWLGPIEVAWFPGEGAAALTARGLAVALGAITAVPLILWWVRGAVLGWGGEKETMDT